MTARMVLLLVFISLNVSACSEALPPPPQSESMMDQTAPAVAEAWKSHSATPASPVAVASPAAHFVATEILGRPTDHSVTVNAVPGEDVDLFFEYGTKPNGYTAATPASRCPASEPIEAIIDGLSPDTEYVYRMRYRRPGEDNFAAGDAHTFHTQRPRGTSFTFDIQADSHLDGKVDPDLYRRTLLNMLGDCPDFLVDLGDTFMTTKTATDEAGVIERHLLQRGFLGLVCHSAPLFIALGNHEGETGWLLDGTPDNMAVWATAARQRYYLNPAPDGFYSGDSTPESIVGLREDYYAWEWGDALFVVLDPYWHTTTKPRTAEEGWAWSLGKEQYDWLSDTLRATAATFKFVFIHHLAGGADAVARGGIEAAPYFEWGGLNADGTAGFVENRPGWEMPVHDLLVETGVTAVFHGHDHLFACQQLDGIVYQEVPQPGTPANYRKSPGTEYGYVQGEILASPGHLRVTVLSDRVQVDYIHAALPADSVGPIANGEVAFSYVIPPPNDGGPAAGEAR